MNFALYNNIVLMCCKQDIHVDVSMLQCCIYKENECVSHTMIQNCHIQRYCPVKSIKHQTYISAKYINI